VRCPSPVHSALAFGAWLASACAAPRHAASPGSSSAPSAPGAEAEGKESAAPATPGTPGAEAPPQEPARLVPIVSSGPPLPELKVKTFGLHIGGGGSEAERASFIRALEQRFPSYLDCYRLVDRPGKTGSFGVDLHIGRQGGAPSVGQARTALGGDEFKRCMVRAFESVRFEKPERPTVVSYSVKFSLGAD
jgi:hypothetical protein